MQPTNLRDLRASGWTSRTVKQEIQNNFLRMLRDGDELFPGIVGYDDTVVPEINIALIAGHDMLFLGEKGQAKSRLMRLLARFLDPEIPYINLPEAPLHDDPYRPISNVCKRFVATIRRAEVPIGWWRREDRYAERLAPGTKFADIIGEIDPAKLAGGTSMSAEEALHFGLIPRMHRGIFAMNELPELDELVQVGLFNILEERDVQIRGYPIKFDIDVLMLFSANPATYNRSGKVIPQLKDRIGAVVHTHYPRQRDLGIQIMEQEAAVNLDGEFPVVVPYFMREIVEQTTILARKSKYVDHQSGVSARFSIANYRTMVASARHRSVRLGEKPGRAADQRFGASLLIVARENRAGHDGKPSDVGAASARRRAGRGDSDGFRRIRRSPRTGPDLAHLLGGGEDRGGRHASLVAICRAAQTRAACLGQGLRGQRLERRRPCGPPASSLC